MDVSGNSGANGAVLIQWPYHGGQNQMFRPDSVGGGYYRLVALNSGKVADVAGGSTANGAAIIQWDWHGGNNQLFRLEPLSDGFYRTSQTQRQSPGRYRQLDGQRRATDSVGLAWR